MIRKSILKVLLVNAALSILLVEAASRAIILHRYGSLGLTRSERKAIAQAGSKDGLVDGLNGIVGKTNATTSSNCIYPHPVFGYYDLCEEDKLWGFRSTFNQAEAINRIKILILGGSVANFLEDGNAITTAFRNELASRGKNDDIAIFNAARGGGKQPIQTQTANALYAMGWKFDIVINVAGHNEIDGPMNYFYKEGINPIVPTHHPNRLRMASKVIANGAGVVERCEQSPWAMRLALIQLLSIRCQRDFIEGRGNNELEWPAFISLMQFDRGSHRDENNALKNAILNWQKSSMAAYHISKANDSTYLEVIQPSQYLAGSKPMTPEERKEIASEPHYEIVGTAFSRIDLEKFGIPLHHILDARNIFKNVNEPVYSDSCCHLNRLGNKILTSEIARRSLDIHFNR
ncbi:hypothetical protein SynMITS9220_00709 [Synechococcus sp. MIT S9220]|uniref:hypothetical protein n=1 Tax=unclassified Synechococcus TaxID=2626047 RepID=UPI00164C11E9|nr:hypothetical protein [Synechococcus sp. MIT S9220]NOL47592.1 hypothetical protein [Synechococcus sp. MIT S9220]QNJ22020.1 hypothetical protein SynMITS9220_00709 [Synechococcus sp. MIT S9220]